MIITNVRISFAVLDVPKEDPSGRLGYSATFLIPKTDKALVKAIEAEIASAISKGKERFWGGKVPHFENKALRDGDAELESGKREGEEYVGHFFINASSKASKNNPEPRKPGLVDAHCRPITEPGTIYSGCIVHADVNAYPYNNTSNKGVAWGLNNVMFVADGERLDGRMNALTAFASFALPLNEAESESADNEDDSLA